MDIGGNPYGKHLEEAIDGCSGDDIDGYFSHHIFRPNAIRHQGICGHCPWWRKLGRNLGSFSCSSDYFRINTKRSCRWKYCKCCDARSKVNLSAKPVPFFYFLLF